MFCFIFGDAQQKTVPTHAATDPKLISTALLKINSFHATLGYLMSFSIIRIFDRTQYFEFRTGRELLLQILGAEQRWALCPQRSFLRSADYGRRFTIAAVRACRRTVGASAAINGPSNAGAPAAAESVPSLSSD